MRKIKNPLEKFGWWWTTAVILLTLLTILAFSFPQAVQAFDNMKIFLPIVVRSAPGSVPVADYIILGWNDLGMHCYDLDYSKMSVLPPYNTVWAQVIRRGDPPQIVTGGIRVEYSFPDNTYSAGKTNFWDFEDKLFGFSLPANIGLTGKGLAGEMDARGDHFIAEGIPLTEFSDSAPTTPSYFQMARLVVKDLAGLTLAQSDIVAPISSEMRCDVCHNSPSPTDFRMNILQKHDEENHTSLASQAASGNPVLCANCHAAPALGMSGNPNLPSLSAAMHGKHKDREGITCYSCHPGPQTQCLRDTMSTNFNMTCEDCHVGGMEMLSQEDRSPWLDEPRCGSCHGAKYAENSGKLYRQSTGHGGLYCESCHNSTHAILPSREAADNLQVIRLQGYAGTLEKCTVCHLTQPASGGPHE